MRRLQRSFLVIVFFMSFFFGVPQKSSAESGQLLTLESCTYKSGGKKYKALCGDLIVPENRSDPNSRMIALPVIKVPAIGDIVQVEPVFWLEGGPGQSNLKFNFPEWLVNEYDIVMIGYRGADGETEMNCPELTSALSQPDYPALSEQAMDLARDALQACSDRILAEGIDLQGYSIKETLADMETAREILGYDQINLFSNSYGTRLAQFYAQNYPEQIHRNLMVSVNPPGNFIWYPQRIEAQLEQYALLCAADEYCSGRTPDLIQSMQNALENVPDRWLFLKIDPEKVKMGSFAMLFQRGTAPAVFDAYLAAEKGDYSGFALISLAAEMMIPNLGIWGHFYAMGGTDNLDGVDYRVMLMPEDSWFGSPMSAQIWIPSDGWQIYPVEEAYRVLQPSSVETLIVSGNIDFSTPAENAAEQLLPLLENGQQVILSDLGHVGDIISTEPGAFQNLAMRFYKEGVVDESLFTHQSINFNGGMRFPLIAKLILIIPVVLIAGIVTLVVVLRRRQKDIKVREK